MCGGYVYVYVCPTTLLPTHTLLPLSHSFTLSYTLILFLTFAFFCDPFIHTDTLSPGVVVALLGRENDASGAFFVEEFCTADLHSDLVD